MKVPKLNAICSKKNHNQEKTHFHYFFITLIMEPKVKFRVNTWQNWKYMLKELYFQNFKSWSEFLEFWRICRILKLSHRLIKHENLIWLTKKAGWNSREIYAIDNYLTKIIKKFPAIVPPSPNLPKIKKNWKVQHEKKIRKMWTENFQKNLIYNN